jgi:hypothetical protein
MKMAKTNGVATEEKYVRENLEPLTTNEINLDGKKSDESNIFAIVKYPKVFIRFVILCLNQ